MVKNYLKGIRMNIVGPSLVWCTWSVGPLITGMISPLILKLKAICNKVWFLLCDSSNLFFSVLVIHKINIPLLYIKWHLIWFSLPTLRESPYRITGDIMITLKIHRLDMHIRVDWSDSHFRFMKIISWNQHRHDCETCGTRV